MNNNKPPAFKAQELIAHRDVDATVVFYGCKNRGKKTLNISSEIICIFILELSMLK